MRLFGVKIQQHDWFRMGHSDWLLGWGRFGPFVSCDPIVARFWSHDLDNGDCHVLKIESLVCGWFYFQRCKMANNIKDNGVLLPLKSHIQWRKRSGYPLPLSRAASPLAPPPPPILLTCHFLAVKRGCCRPAHHLRSSQTAGSKLWISPPENQDRPPARQSAPYDCPVDKHPRHAEETSATKSNRRSPRPHDGRTKKQRKCGSTHYVALPHTCMQCPRNATTVPLAWAAMSRSHLARWGLKKVFCTFGPNLVILAWMGEKLSCGQIWSSKLAKIWLWIII